jgi:hypothetical protein
MRLQIRRNFYAVGSEKQQNSGTLSSKTRSYKNLLTEWPLEASTCRESSTIVGDRDDRSDPGSERGGGGCTLRQIVLTMLARHSKHPRTPMRRSLALLAALATLTCRPTAGGAQSTSELLRKPVARTPSAGEEAAPAVDPAVLDRCRQRADDQKLKEGPERKAFMGTCVAPED